MTKAISKLSRKKFVVFNLITNSIVGYLHRQTERSFYVYPVAPKWKRVPTGTEKKFQKETHLVLALAEKVDGGNFAFFSPQTITRTMNHLNAKLKMNNQHPVMIAQDKLNLALGPENFVLSLYAGAKTTKPGIYSVMCNNSADAFIANLIINQA
jgi:hypothetical protein